LDDSTESLLHLRINNTLTLDEAEKAFKPDIIKCPIENYLNDISNKLAVISTLDSLTPKKEDIKWKIFHEVANNLRKRQDIIIKPADKNLGVTVLNRDWYISTATSTKYLGDTTTYRQIHQPLPIQPIVNELELICKQQDWLSTTKITKLLTDLTSDHARDKVKLCRMYFMPKLHKTPLALRPICASQGWITYWTSVYIHLTLFPLLRQIPSYITNSAQLVSRLDTIKLPKYYQFIQADVDNLYPSINIDDALKALCTFLEDKSHFPNSQISFILKLTKWVLKNNYVTFGESTYLQICGTAMGTPCAVVVACIYMHILEQEALTQFARQHYIIRSIFLFNRFIDDYLILVSDYDTGLSLMELLNSRRDTIHITFKIRNSEAEFLDLTLYKTQPDQISVKSYTKPMNKHLFIPPTSCHPPHIFNGWIIGYGRRLRLNNQSDIHYQNSIDLFESSLLQRGYKQQMITDTLSVIPDRQIILGSIHKRDHLSKPFIGTPFVVTHTPAIHISLTAIKQAIAITEEATLDPHYPQIFNTTTATPLISFKRGKNLRDIVAPSTLSK
jgi:hypothetical protein